MSKIIKLSVELVPKSCHFSNVRTTVKPKDWDKIRFLSYDAAGNKCEICGETGKKQGFNHDLECHEIWEYDDENKIQKLIGLISLCPKCHECKHIGRAIAMGKQTECFAHLSKVNNWTRTQIDEHVTASFETYGERSKYQWKLDISLLAEPPYSLSIDPGKKRIFEVKKWKRKKRKSKNKNGLKKCPPRKLK